MRRFTLPLVILASLLLGAFEVHALGELLDDCRVGCGKRRETLAEGLDQDRTADEQTRDGWQPLDGAFEFRRRRDVEGHVVLIRGAL